MSDLNEEKDMSNEEESEEDSSSDHDGMLDEDGCPPLWKLDFVDKIDKNALKILKQIKFEVIEVPGPLHGQRSKVSHPL